MQCRAQIPQCKSRLLTKQHDALCLVISCIQDDGLNFIRAYGMNSTCIPFNTDVKTACQSPTSRLKSKTQTIVSPSIKYLKKVKKADAFHLNTICLKHKTDYKIQYLGTIRLILTSRPNTEARIYVKTDEIELFEQHAQKKIVNEDRRSCESLVKAPRILPTLKSLGGLGKCSVTNHCNRGHPLNFAISPVLDFGSPFKQASDVSATVIPHELNKKPTCCGGVSDVDNGNSIGSGTSPRNMHPYQAVMKLERNFNLNKNNH
uniref:Uncharacterized protein n=1 Tax=Glossina palpalis gambiensis TaxID=67801 RepID=A0A1B0B194_9MUSC